MYEQTFWKDHLTDPKNTYNIIQNKDGTVTLIPAGKVIQQGTSMSAEHFNNIEKALGDSHLAYKLLSLAFRNHSEDKQNPHSVTAGQVESALSLSIVWKNESPDSAFAAQNLSFPSRDNLLFYMIKGITATGSNDIFTATLHGMGDTAHLVSCDAMGDEYIRTIKLVSPGAGTDMITFSTAVNNNQNELSVFAVPVEIWAICSFDKKEDR